MVALPLTWAKLARHFAKQLAEFFAHGWRKPGPEIGAQNCKGPRDSIADPGRHLAAHLPRQSQGGGLPWRKKSGRGGTGMMSRKEAFSAACDAGHAAGEVVETVPPHPAVHRAPPG